MTEDEEFEILLAGLRRPVSDYTHLYLRQCPNDSNHCYIAGWYGPGSGFEERISFSQARSFTARMFTRLNLLQMAMTKLVS